MATVPLSKRDCVRASQAVRREAVRLLAYGAEDREEAVALRDLANRLEGAADLDGAGPPQDRPRPPVLPVDTFPVCAEGDGVERCAVGRDKHPGCYMTDEQAYGMTPAQRQEVDRLESTLLKRRANRRADPAAWGDSPHDQEPR